MLDPLKNLFPMYGDVLRCINADTNLRATHAKDRHDDVRTDPNGFANSSREHQHVRFLACLESLIIVIIRLRGAGPFGLSLHSFALRLPRGKFIPSPRPLPRLPSGIRGRRFLFRVRRVVTHIVLHHRAMLLAS